MNMPLSSNMVLKSGAVSDYQLASPLQMGFTEGRHEPWRRQRLVPHPNLLPIEEVDPSFAPSARLCNEMRAELAPVHFALISPTGRLTSVQRKIRHNPEDRRTVVVQIPAYARAISRWTCANRQREPLGAVSGKEGIVSYEAAKESAPELEPFRRASCWTVCDVFAPQESLLND